MKKIDTTFHRARRLNRCLKEVRPGNPAAGAFTIVEILIVVVIIAIAAMVAIPMVGSADSMQIRSAANVIAADIEYARSMAISRQTTYKVIFDIPGNGYRLEDLNGIIEHPVRKGFQYVVNFGSSSQLNRIVLLEANFGGYSQISFGPLGNPDNGGLIRLRAGGCAATISVEPVTGFIMISD